MLDQLDRVDFVAYNPESKQVEVVAKVYLKGDELVYEGRGAATCREMVEQSAHLAPYRKLGGYPLLAELCQAFRGTYFRATDVQEATLL